MPLVVVRFDVKEEFVILGDLNCDPVDGDSFPGAITSYWITLA